MNSPLRTRVRIDKICRDYELEISEILLIVDVRVMDKSDFDVIIGMDWLTAHRVIIDNDRRRITAYTLDGICVIFQRDKHDILPQVVYHSRWHRWMIGWLASLTLEDEVRPDFSLPRVVYEYDDVFLDEIPGLPLQRDVDFTIELHPGMSTISMTPHRMVSVEL